MKYEGHEILCPNNDGVCRSLSSLELQTAPFISLPPLISSSSNFQSSLRRGQTLKSWEGISHISSSAITFVSRTVIFSTWATNHAKLIAS